MKMIQVLSLTLGLAVFVSPLLAQETGTLSSDQLDNLMAPVALYPDPLLAQMLVASTYPHQIDEAGRLLRARPSPVDDRPWDVSVKAVAHYTLALQFMDHNLDWTTTLGRSYVKQPVDTMKAIQRLRRLAQATGTLRSGQEIEVVESGGDIRIWPAGPELLFVPVYDPATAMRPRVAQVGTPLISFGSGQKIGAWLNRDCDWAKSAIVYHGWEGSANWVERSRPAVQMSKVYLDTAYSDSGGDRSILNSSVNYEALNRWNGIHPKVGFGLRRSTSAATGSGNSGVIYSSDIECNINVHDSRLNQFRGYADIGRQSPLPEELKPDEAQESRPSMPLFVAAHPEFEPGVANEQVHSSQAETVQMPRGYQEKLFHTPEEAMTALGEAASTDDRAALEAIFGHRNLSKLLTGDSVVDDGALKQFAGKFQKSELLEKATPTTYRVVVGEEKWPFPIPIIKEGGHWRFNTALGLDELSTQKLGANELSAILSCRAFVLAQWEYRAASGHRSRDGQPVYAQRFLSTPGGRDGLYWPTKENETRSPLGALLSSAATPDTNGFHGYDFKILTRQGNEAPGGRLNYVNGDGDMVSGFALIAYPTHWGISGIMTYAVNQQGRVYGINFGLRTAEIVSEIDEYNPDPSWKLVDEGYPPAR